MIVNSKCTKHSFLVRYESTKFGVPYSGLCPCCNHLLFIGKGKSDAEYGYCENCDCKWGGFPIFNLARKFSS